MLPTTGTNEGNDCKTCLAHVFDFSQLAGSGVFHFYEDNKEVRCFFSVGNIQKWESKNHSFRGRGRVQKLVVKSKKILSFPLTLDF